MREYLIRLFALAILICPAVACAEEPKAVKTPPPVIAGLELKVVLRVNEIGEPQYFARFTNQSEMSRFVVRPMDGSMHGRSMPYYLMTASDENGNELEKHPPLCGNVGEYGLYANLKWPDHYVFKIKPGEIRDFSISADFNFEPGKKYELKVNYAYWPDADLWQHLKMPKQISLGIVRGTPCQITAPEIEYLTSYYPRLEAPPRNFNSEFRPRSAFPSNPPKEIKITPALDKATKEWLGANEEKRWTYAEINSRREIRSLNMSGHPLSEYELRLLQAFPKLKFLWVADAEVENSKLEMLLSLDHLIMLRIDDSNLDDVGLQHLQKLTGLRRLMLTDTDVSKEAIIAFRRARSDVNLIVETTEEADSQ